jgi:short-subunit dehydrogenase
MPLSTLMLAHVTSYFTSAFKHKKQTSVLDMGSFYGKATERLIVANATCFFDR